MTDDERKLMRNLWAVVHSMAHDQRVGPEACEYLICQMARETVQDVADGTGKPT